jgi:hypothetical protein
MQWSFASKGFAAATMMLLFVGGAVYVRTILNQPVEQEIAEHRTEPPQQPPKPVENEARFDYAPSVVVSEYGSRPATKERRPLLSKKPTLATVDSAISQPPSFIDAHRQSAIFQIDASNSLEPFKVSLDDGRGNARTISVPTITFGSQRVLPNANQSAQKRGNVW